MKRWIIFALLVGVVSLGGWAQDGLELPSKYLDAALVLGNWLTENLHAEVPSWPYSWDPTRTDVGIAMDCSRHLKQLADLTGDSAYETVAKDSVDFWIATGLIVDETTIDGWLWDVGGAVSEIGWEDGVFDKVQGAFVGGYWPTKGEFEGVRRAAISFCGSVVRPLAALLEFGDTYADTIDIVKGWLFTDLDAKMPTSGESERRAFMGAQSLVDYDADGLLEVEYSLWGSSRQSAGQNSRLIPVLLGLGEIELAESIGDWLIDVMWDEERGSFQTLFDITEQSCMTFEEYQDYSDINARTAYGLLNLYEATGNEAYLDHAVLTLDWLADEETFVAATNEGTHTYFTKPTVYGNHIVATAFAKGYAVTGNPKYLALALTTTDFLLSQMDDPFTGFESNAWTVVEVLEAVLALLVL